MPDLDILSAGISPAWARSYRLLAGGGTTTEVAQAAVQSLASSLRRCGGFPEAMAMGRIIDAVACGQLTPPATFARLRELVLRAGGGLHVCMAARGAERLIAELTPGERPRQQGEAPVLADSGAQPEAALVALYRRYCAEWAHFPLPLPGWVPGPVA